MRKSPLVSVQSLRGPPPRLTIEGWASLAISIRSWLAAWILLEQSQDLKAGDKIGFFSYGSGAVSEIFSGRLVEGYKDLLRSDRLDTFAKRQQLSVADYEKLFYEEAQLDDTGSTQFADYQTGAFRLAEISEHQRIYKGH